MTSSSRAVPRASHRRGRRGRGVKNQNVCLRVLGGLCGGRLLDSATTFGLTLFRHYDSLHMKKSLIVLALLGGAVLQAQPAGLPDPVRKAAERITAERLARDLEYLSSD